MKALAKARLRERKESDPQRLSVARSRHRDGVRENGDQRSAPATQTGNRDLLGREDTHVSGRFVHDDFDGRERIPVLVPRWAPHVWRESNSAP